MHVDIDVHGSSTVKFLMTHVGANTHKNLANLSDNERLTFIDAVGDLKCGSGIYFISEELAEVLKMKKGQYGQLHWIPIIERGKTK